MALTAAMKSQYKKEDKLVMYNTCGSDYQKQNDFIYGNESRNKFIAKMVQKIEGNCLLLFTKKELINT